MVREEMKRIPKGEMSDWDDQADAVVGVAQGGVSQSSAIPAVITPISMPAFLRPSSYFLSSLKILILFSLSLWFNSLHVSSPPPRLPTPKTQRRGVP